MLIANPDVASWWIWKKMEKLDQIFPAPDVADASWF